MSKRKQGEMDVEDDASDEHTAELVNVNFDYYNVNASNDYHAIHRLFIQLFGADAERVQTGPLTDLVVRVAEESGVGSTIKTEEDEGSDPYAVLTVISCRDQPGLKTLLDYVLSKTKVDEGFHNTLTSLLKEGHVGLVLSERLINMPVQVMPPMYRMLSEEIEEANQEDRFTDYLFVSRVYRLTTEDEERDPKRYKGTEKEDGVYSYHPEDEEIMQFASHTVTYEGGRVMLVPGNRFASMVDKITGTYVT